MEVSIIEYSILLECLQFLEESDTIPIYKYFPKFSRDQDKIKIRLKTKTETFYNHVDNSFKFNNFNNRSLDVYTAKDENIIDLVPYYVFIPDGYRYMYAKDNMKIQLKRTFQDLTDKMIRGSETFEELIKYSYKNEDLVKGLVYNDIITFYNIPYYYIIRADLSYQETIKFYGNIQN